MAANLDLSLDDIINKSTARRGFKGPNRHVTVRNPVRKSPYSVSQTQVVREARRGSNTNVQEMVFVNGAVPSQHFTKLYVSNLDHRVSNDDIQLLFSEEGELERYSIHYDQFGQSKGTAEVVFKRQSDALAAIKKYNNMNLDGKPLQIELVVTSLVTPAAMSLGQSSLLGRPNDVFVRPPLGQSSLLGRPNDVFVREERKIEGIRYHNGFTHSHLPKMKNHIQKASFKEIGHNSEKHHSRRVEAKRNSQKKVTVKDLDEDLEQYRLQAMQISEEN